MDKHIYCKIEKSWVTNDNLNQMETFIGSTYCIHYIWHYPLSTDVIQGKYGVTSQLATRNLFSHSFH